jgi:hypothetical protein
MGLRYYWAECRACERESALKGRPRKAHVFDVSEVMDRFGKVDIGRAPECKDGENSAASVTQLIDVTGSRR